MEKKFWIDFVEGKISVEEMLCKIKENKKLVVWLNSIVSSDEKMCIVKKITNENDYKDFQMEMVEFEVERYLEEELKSKNTTLGTYLNIFSTFADILLKAFPNEEFKVDNTLEKKFNFMLDACPEYIGGIEADKLIDRIYNANQNVSKKQFKEEIKKLFNIEKCKFPRWIQSPEWPISKSGKPMKFVKQITDKNTEITKFIFEDIDTKQETIIEQFT